MYYLNTSQEEIFSDFCMMLSDFDPHMRNKILADAKTQSNLNTGLADYG